MRKKPVQTRLDIDWRRNKVLELSSTGNTQTEISRLLQLSISTINRDIFYIRREARKSIQKFLTERLPEEYSKSLILLNLILKDSYNLSQQSNIDAREKIMALNLAKEVCIAKMELMTGSSAIDDTIKFIKNYKDKINNDYKNKENKLVEIKRSIVNNEQQTEQQIQVIRAAAAEGQQQEEEENKNQTEEQKESSSSSTVDDNNNQSEEVIQTNEEDENAVF